jgi:SAM-dependent methyltransferase
MSDPVSPSSGSVAFDRVAGEYDRTRALPEKTMGKVLALLATELRGRGMCLEVGVGTGRLSRPLSALGIRMAGVDVSWPMLDRLRANAGGSWPFPVAMADATALPFGDRTMGAGLASHVLHLISGWKDALAELVRVVCPGGVVLVDVGNWRGPGVWTVLRDRFCLEADIRRPFIGTQDPLLVDAQMRSLGARLRILPPIYEVVSMTAEEQISALERGVFSFTWQVDEDARRAAARRTRTWAREHVGPLEEPHRRRRRIVLRAYDLA